MKFSRLSIAAVLALVAATSSVFAADETYTIKLHRAEKVGDLYDLHMTLDETQTSTVTLPEGAPQVQKEVTKGDLTGRVEVKEVDKAGEPITMLLTVTKLVNGDGKEVVDADKEIEVKRGEKEVTAKFTKGGELSDEAKKLISEMFHTYRPDQPTDDDVFGTATPRKAGDTWPVNTDTMAKSMSGEGLVMDAKNLKGTVTLKAVETVGSGKAPALRIIGTMDAKDIKPPVPDPSVKVDSCNMTMEYGGLFPTDVTAEKLEMSMKMTMEMHMSAGPGVKVDVTALNSQTETITPVPMPAKK